MAGRFRFTPLCCCSQPEEADVCVPDCTLIADRIVLATEEMTIDAAVSASRHCPGEDFWHGFHAPGDRYVYPLTVETVTVNGTPRARAVANSKVWQISYCDGAVKLQVTPNSSDTFALKYYANLINSSNATQSSVDNYFVTDSFDHRVHYRTNVQEPAWVQMVAVPYDYAHWPFHFEYDGTEAGYAAAREVRFSAVPKYLTAADCGAGRRTVSADFTVGEEAWSQYHTGTAECYTVSGEDLDAWVMSLADGTHHYGAEKFYVVRLGIVRTNWSRGQDGIPARTFPAAAAEVLEFRFNRDAPAFTPMAPSGVYTVSRADTLTSSVYPGVAGTERWVYGKPDGIPSSWKWTPFETPGDFYGRYFPLVIGVSHRSTDAYNARNGPLPLGRYTFSPPDSNSQSFPRASAQTDQMVYLAKLTLDKKVYEWTREDWDLFLSANMYTGGSSFLPGGMWGFGRTGEPKAWCAWWHREDSTVYGTTDTTPSDLIRGGHVWAWNRNGFTALDSSGVLRPYNTGGRNFTGLATSAAAPRADWSLVANTNASFYSVDPSDWNKYGKIEFFSDIVEAPTGSTRSTFIPEITDAIIDEICPSGSYVLTGVVQDQTDKTFYYFPYVWCGMLAGYL